MTAVAHGFCACACLRGAAKWCARLHPEACQVAGAQPGHAHDKVIILSSTLRKWLASRLKHCATQAMRHLESSAASASEHVRAQKQEAAHRLETFDAELDTQRGQRNAKQQRQAQRQSDDLLCMSHILEAVPGCAAHAALSKCQPAMALVQASKGPMQHALVVNCCSYPADARLYCQQEAVAGSW